MEFNNSFYEECWQAFGNLREQTSIRINQFIERLHKESNSSCHSISQSYKFQKSMRAWSFIKLLNQHFQKTIFFLYRIPKYIKQYRLMKTLDLSDENLIIAIDTKRLKPQDLEKSKLKTYLKKLTYSFDRKIPSSICQDIEQANNMVLFDPLRSSYLWQFNKACWTSNIFILDVDYLILLGIFSLFKNPIIKFPKLIREMTIFNFKKVVSEVILLGIQHSLSNYSSKSYFFTSNSTAIELLRFYLLQDEKCNSVCEIMHGLPALFYEKYLADILRIAKKYGYSAYEKHSSISKIPNLPVYGILDTDVKCGIEYAINTYLNQYIANNDINQANARKFIENEFNQLFRNITISDDTRIVTFIGGVADEKNYLYSQMYQLECFIMQAMRAKLQKTNQNYLLLYAPHPANAFNKFEKDDFFKKNNIILCRETIFSWLVSDDTAALFSAAVFEAVLFNINVFIPVKETDLIFPGKLLEFLPGYHKLLQKNLLSAISDFIDNPTKQPCSINVLARAEKRLKSILND